MIAPRNLCVVTTAKGLNMGDRDALSLEESNGPLFADGRTSHSAFPPSATD